MNLRRCIFALYLVLIGGIGLAAGVFFIEAREEYARLNSIQAENRRLVADAELRLKYQEKSLVQSRTSGMSSQAAIQPHLKGF